MGLPGSGKGTQGKMMSDEHRLHLISMGEIIRLYVSGERRIRMLSGELLDDDEVISLLSSVLEHIISKDKCVLDGFPRTIHQAEWLLEKSNSENFKIDAVINLVASEETVRHRLRARGRSDDREEVIQERFKEYSDLTLPLLDWYKVNNVKVINIDAEKSVDEVNDQVAKAVFLHSSLKLNNDNKS